VVNSSTDRKRQVLVVEDEAAIRELLRLHLALGGFEVAEVTDGARALAVGRTTRFDLIVLDVMLPGIDGVTLCRAYRSEGVNLATPILMLTARDTESDKVLGLESGADDYLTKPFGVREFVARIRALLRRPRRMTPTQPERPVTVTAGNLEVDPARRIARLEGSPIELTPHEFDMLYLLASNRGIVFTREALVQRIWGDHTHVTTRSVDTLIKRIRRKIEPDPDQPRFILTVWGTGYKFADV